MDYMPVNIVAGRAADADVEYFTTVIGDYDKMAIQYGYGLVIGEYPGMPHPQLDEIADHDYPFATDEDGADASGMDAYSSTFDMSADPVKFHVNRLQLVQELRPGLLNRVVATGDEFTRFADEELMLLRAIMLSGVGLTKFIGGYKLDRARKTNVADQAPPVAMIDTAVQAQALEGIMWVLGQEPAGKHHARYGFSSVDNKDCELYISEKGPI